MLANPTGPLSAAILVIDPDPLNQRKLRDQLMRLGHTARSADDCGTALDIMEETPPDVVIFVSPVERDESWTELQEQLLNWNVPALELNDPEPQISDDELRERVTSALSSRQSHEALLMENARLAAERLYDPITGLFNRRYMMIRVEEEIRRSSRHGYPLSCLLLDIDGFEEINEEHGHHVGDAVLRTMAHIVTRTLRATDIVARYRDDEFISLLTDTDSTGAQIAANRIRDAIAGQIFTGQPDGPRIEVTVAIGVAYWHPSPKPGEGTWEPQLIGLAERALKAAKLSGPNRMVMLQAA
jgi:diguanylate cyclase (GGDEF)-like protein